MKTFRYKTNINCDSCVRMVQPVLDAQSNHGSWEVDTQSEIKLLKVTSETINSAELIKSLAELGFEAELIA